MSERANHKGIHENDEQSDKDRADVDAPEPAGWKDRSEGPEQRLGQTVKDEIYGVEGGDIDPRENSSEDDDPEIKPENKMEDLSQRRQKIPEEDQLTLSAQNILVFIEKFFKLVSGDDVARDIEG